MTNTAAIAGCRVSTAEQKLSNSLGRQQGSVVRAAEELGVSIVREWSGDVSSKSGTNVNRKDLKEMQEYCRQNKAVKYLILDEPDRFMRSVDEAFYFEVSFKILGVKVWYASDPELNTDNLQAKMLKFMKYFAAEGSNVERQNKSVAGHRNAVLQGRYTFPPKPGYGKGRLPGVHEPHPTEFEPFQRALKEVAMRGYTPTEALKRLNASDFTKFRPPMKGDKFQNFLADPYYAGIIEVNKQVQARCEVGQHKAMISLDEHHSILEIMSGRINRIHKPRQQFNPEFPLSKWACECGGKLVGFNHTNGHGGRWKKYRCRQCGRQNKLDTIHSAIDKLLSGIQLVEASRGRLLKALSIQADKAKQDDIQRLTGLEKRCEDLAAAKRRLVDAFATADTSIQADIQEQIELKKSEIRNLEREIGELTQSVHDDWVEFAKFALDYTHNLEKSWWSLDPELRNRCKELLFPADIKVLMGGKVYTSEISPVYRLVDNKKAPDLSSDALLVELRGIAPRSAG